MKGFEQKTNLVFVLDKINYIHEKRCALEKVYNMRSLYEK